MLSPPATSQLPLRDIPTDGTRPIRGVPSIGGGGGADGAMSGEEVGSRRASAPLVGVVWMGVGEPVEDRSSSGAQTSPRADIHLCGRVLKMSDMMAASEA